MMRRTAALRNEGGFTLVELLVSLSLLVIMLALINGALRFGRRVWEVSDQVERTQNVAAFRNLLEQRLSETLPLLSWDERGVAQPSFHGTSEQLTFLTPMSSRDGLPAGLFSATLKLMPASANGGRPLGLEFKSVAGPNLPPAPTGHAPVLLDSIARLTIRYHGLTDRSSEARWFDEWQGQNSLPRVVAVDVQFARGDPRAWPPLRAELKLAPKQPSGR
jgi:general secretion pathway protein J